MSKEGSGGGSGASSLPPPPACDRLLASLQDCIKKHPHQSDVVCAHLHRATAWCLIRQTCPEEVCDLEDCVGVVPPRSARVPQGPPMVPERCRQQGIRLEMCLVAHQVEERGG